MATQKLKNRKAFHEFHVLEQIEVGLVLIGSEVKAIREGLVNFADSYVRLSEPTANRRTEAWLMNLHIGEYKNAPAFAHEPTRRRKLLLHRRELRKIEKKIDEKGLTIVPLELYFTKRGLCKVRIGICRGKKLHDKRQATKERDILRDMDRERARYD